MKRLVIAIVAMFLASLATSAPAEARTCPPASVGGPAVAEIKVKGRSVPVKAITYRKGGPLDPPHTNKAAGISTRNAPLTAKKGATVITWHVRWGPGCYGTLNPVTTMPIGSTFTIGAVGKTPRTYQITSRVTVPKGVLKRSWFSPTGPHRIVMITCNDLRGGLFHRTMAITATLAPVQPTTTTTTTTTKPASTTTSTSTAASSTSTAAHSVPGGALSA